MKVFIEVIIQTMLAFFSILFIARLLGRQQVAQLTFHEYVNGITFGSIAANLATDVSQRTYQHFVGLILFGILTGLMTFIALKKRNFRKVIEGEPVVIIQDGKILEQSLKRVRYSMDELNELLRQKDCFSPDDVEYGILEMNGKLSVIKRLDKRNVTVGDLNLLGTNITVPTEIIIGGQVIYENLKKRKLNGIDVMKALKKEGINRVTQVMYMTVDESGKFYIDQYDDKLSQAMDMSENNRGI